jgi:hypothetical protein
MLKVRLRRSEASTLCHVLQEIGAWPGLPTDMRRTARHYARATGPSMSRREAQRVAWFLRHASEQQRLPADEQAAVRSWAAYLEDRI